MNLYSTIKEFVCDLMVKDNYVRTGIFDYYFTMCNYNPNQNLKHRRYGSIGNNSNSSSNNNNNNITSHQNSPPPLSASSSANANNINNSNSPPSPSASTNDSSPVTTNTSTSTSYNVPKTKSIAEVDHIRKNLQNILSSYARVNAKVTDNPIIVHLHSINM